MEQRRLRVEFDDFGRASVLSGADGRDVTVEEFLSEAALYCLSERGSGRVSWRVPKFRRLTSAREPCGNSGHEEARADGGREVSLELADCDWRALREEAARREVPVEQLVQHAALYLVSELDLARPLEARPVK